MTVISTNVASLNAQAALASNARGLGKAMQQLSTGTRINSASDDAAGLAVSTRLTSQIRGLNTAVRNANDAISMIQTAEGAAVEITNMLQRMRELAVQSANDTNTSADRDFLDLEYQQLTSEMNRVANTTQWNGMNILNSAVNSGTFIYQVGANANQTVEISVGNFTTSNATARTTNNTATVAPTTAPAAGTAQVSTITVAGDYKAGDRITVTVGSVSKYVDVTSEDMAATTPQNAIATKIAALSFSDAGGLTAVRTNAAVAFTATTANSPFTMTTEVTKIDQGRLSSVANSDIRTRSNANSAISSIDTSLTNINKERATMGAVVNRLQYTVDNLTNVSTKATESRSRVLDTDYSQATTELSKRQIISQAATAMLAQANQQPQTVLSLLK